MSNFLSNRAYSFRDMCQLNIIDHNEWYHSSDFSFSNICIGISVFSIQKHEKDNSVPLRDETQATILFLSHLAAVNLLTI